MEGAANATQCAALGCVQESTTWAWVGGGACGFVLGILFTLAAFGASILCLWLVNYRRGALVARIRSTFAGGGGGLDESPSYESLGGLASDLGPPRFSLDLEHDPAARGRVSSALILGQEDSMNPVDYQGHWEAIEQYIEEDFVLRDQERLLEVLAAHFIFCIASGLVEQEAGGSGRQVMKYYTYARASGGDVLCMMEIVVVVASGGAHVTLKTNSDTEGRNLVDYFFTAVSPLISHALPFDEESY